MCGIVGIIGVEPVAPRLVDALKRLAAPYGVECRRCGE